MQRSPAQTVECFAVELVGERAVAQQCPRAHRDSETQSSPEALTASVNRASASAAMSASPRRPQLRSVPVAPRRRRTRRAPLRSPRRPQRERLLMPADSVGEDRGGPVTEMDGKSLAACRRVFDRCADECRGLGFSSTEGGEQHGSVGRDPGSRRSADHGGLRDRRGGRCEVPAPGGDQPLSVERERQRRERTRSASAVGMRVMIASQLSKSQRIADAVDASTAHWSPLSTGTSSSRNASTARRSAGAAASRPFVTRAASPSSRRSEGGWSALGPPCRLRRPRDLGRARSLRRCPRTWRRPMRRGRPHAPVTRRAARAASPRQQQPRSLASGLGGERDLYPQGAAPVRAGPRPALPPPPSPTARSQCRARRRGGSPALAASARSTRCPGSAVNATERCRNPAAAASPPRACAPPAERSSSAATSSFDARCRSRAVPGTPIRVGRGVGRTGRGRDAPGSDRRLPPPGRRQIGRADARTRRARPGRGDLPRSPGRPPRGRGRGPRRPVQQPAVAQRLGGRDKHEQPASRRRKRGCAVA